MPSAALAKIIGDGPIKRDEIVQQLWAYIEKNGLRDPKDDLIILPNGLLAKVLGESPIDLFDIVEQIAPHLTTTE